MEHPDITRMNRRGYLGTAHEESHLYDCKNCDAELHRGNTIIEYYGEPFCNTDCLTESFADDPFQYGIEQTEQNEENEHCKHCNKALPKGQTITVFYDEPFCDTECAVESFTKNPFAYGTEKTSLQ